MIDVLPRRAKKGQMASISEKDVVERRTVRATSIWAGLFETVDAPGMTEQIQVWETRSEAVVKPLQEAEQLAAQDFQIRINAR
jgi:hypothetical protein